MAREPSISKCWVRWRPGSSFPPPSNRYAKLVPSRCDCSIPSISSGGAIPTSSRTVGVMSTAWAYWRRRCPADPSDGWPGSDDAGIGHAALVHLALPALEGRVAGHRPAPRIVVVGQRPADLVDAAVHLADAGSLEVRQAPLVDGALLAALGAGAVVRDQHDDGVVGVTHVFDEVEHTPELLVGVGEEGGEALHEPLGQCRSPLVERSQAGTQAGRGVRTVPAGTHAQRELAGKRLVPPAVPPLGETAPVVLDPLRSGAWCGEWHAPVAK